MYLTGYNIGIDAVRELAESSDGTSAHAVAEMTRENSVAIVYGYPERGAEDAIFNSAQLLTADGTPLANYRKTHLFGDLDNSMFCASDADSAVVELGGWRVGMLICYDVEFPENTRKLALSPGLPAGDHPRTRTTVVALRRTVPTGWFLAGGAPRRRAVGRRDREDLVRCDPDRSRRRASDVSNRILPAHSEHRFAVTTEHRFAVTTHDPR